MSNNIISNIQSLLFKSGISRYRISKDTGINQSTLSRYVNGEIDIMDMSLGHAIKLSDYYHEEVNLKGLGKLGDTSREWAEFKHSLPKGKDKKVTYIEVEGNVCSAIIHEYSNVYEIYQRVLTENTDYEVNPITTKSLLNKDLEKAIKTKGNVAVIKHGSMSMKFEVEFSKDKPEISLRFVEVTEE